MRRESNVLRGRDANGERTEDLVGRSLGGGGPRKRDEEETTFRGSTVG